eukprot:scaffold3400_cov169-Amphora_coffeaeformis.AAC.7
MRDIIARGGGTDLNDVRDIHRLVVVAVRATEKGGKTMTRDPTDQLLGKSLWEGGHGGVQKEVLERTKKVIFVRIHVKQGMLSKELATTKIMKQG